MTAADQDILSLAREEAGGSLDDLERALLDHERGAAAPDAIDAMFRAAHSIKGTAGMVGLADAAAIAHAMEDRLETCREEGVVPAGLIDPLLRATDALRLAVAGEAVSVPAVLAAMAGSATPAHGPPPAAPPPVPPVAAEAPGRAIRVGAEKVDRMLDAVGEASLHHRRLEQGEDAWAEAVGRDVAEEQLGTGRRLLDDLQDAVLGMRTLPLSSITTSYPRAVRDLALAEGRQVELVITGADTPLDRVILEGLSETIVHLLRNAVAHGIEPPDERERAGKPRTGRIDLRAEPRGSMVVVEVADDGRGVSEELAARARAAGSLTDLLCAPGFSTAGSVTDIAGRGVGLDAVKAHVERLGGTLEVAGRPDGGLAIELLLPLTLAVLQVLVCERGGHAFGLPLASVREVVSASETVALGGRRSLALRGESVPLADLAGVIGAPAPPLGAAPPALVVARPTGTVAVACDRVLGDREVVVKSLGSLLAGVAGYLGAAILEDGRVALILDPAHLLAAHAAGAARSLAAPPTARQAARVLVVDDQFTVRELQRSILETAGYRVQTARDGAEALGCVTRDADIDMVLTDVQMPEMDGFELLRAIRALPERGSLPVAIVTSQGGEEQRRRGAEEGADAYIVKQEFDQQTLLDTVGRLVGP